MVQFASITHHLSKQHIPSVCRIYVFLSAEKGYLMGE